MRDNLNIFSLPSEIVCRIFSFVHLRGPRIAFIEGEPSDEQKKAVTRLIDKIEFIENEPNDEQKKADTGLIDGDSKNPELSLYHLIISSRDRSTQFKIGFCKRLKDGSIIYETADVNSESALNRYLKEHFTTLKKNQFQNQLLLKYMEIEIKKAKGLTAHRLRNTIRMAGVSRAIRNSMSQYAEVHPDIFGKSIELEMLDDLLHHVAYCEWGKAIKIVKVNPSLLLSQWKAPVESCAPEINYHSISAFQLALVTGNWPMLEMMLLEINTAEGRFEYRRDWRIQLEALEEKRETIKYTLDNLLNTGVRVVSNSKWARMKKRYQADIVNRNAYYLIIEITRVRDQPNVVTSCVLAFQNPKSPKECLEYRISEKDVLFSSAASLYDGMGWGFDSDSTYFTTRDPHFLDCVRTLLNKQGVETFYIKEASTLDLSRLLAVLNLGYIPKTIRDRDLEEKFHGAVTAEMRLFSGNIWKFWKSSKLPRESNESKITAFLDQPFNPKSFSDKYKGRVLFPLPTSLQDTFDLYGESEAAKMWLIGPSFFKAFVAMETKKREILRKSLHDNQTLKNDDLTICNTEPAHKQIKN